MIQPQARARFPSVMLPLAGLGASYLGMVVFFSLLAAWGGGITLHHLLPNDLAVTHALVLGWLTMAVMGAMYQFGPNGLHRPILSERLGYVQLAISFAGWTGMVVGFHTGRTAVLATFGGLAFTGVVLFLFNMVPCIWRAGPSITRSYLLASLTFLLATVLVGFAFALNRHFLWFAVPSNMLAIHVTLGFFGWLSLTLMGVGYRMLPIHAARGPETGRMPRIILYAIVVGIVALATALHFDAPGPVLVAAAAPLAAGGILFAARGWRRYFGRPAAERERGVYVLELLASAACLVLAVAAGTWGLSGSGQSTAPERWALAFGVLVLCGWVGLAVIAQSYRIIPFLVWFHRYRRQPRSGPVPLLTDLYPARFEQVSAGLYSTAIGALVVSILADSGAGVRAAGAVGALGGAGHIVTLAHAAWRTGSSRRPESPTRPVVAPGARPLPRG